MDGALRERVQQRADDRCEYCRLPQEFSELHFHVEHIIRASVGLLRMNDPERLGIRALLAEPGIEPG